ncbi:T9SS type A sorting domain-containing protein [bacterium]|nr:T9SS type A sorting domain-containing protein [bacterium]
MKKVLLITMLLLAMSSLLSAQITFRVDDFPCTPGTHVVLGVGAFLDNEVGPAGANQHWDFSHIVTQSLEQTETWALPDQLPGADNFPLANLCQMGTEGPDGTRLYAFFNQGGTTLDPVGHSFYVGAMDSTFIITMERRGHYFSFPLNYGDEWDLVQVMDVGGETEIDSMHLVVDAWGTMTDQMGEFECLRLQVHDINHNLDTGHIRSEYRYYWYAADYGEICHAQSDVDEEEPYFSGGSLYRVTSVDGWDAVQEIPSEIPLDIVIQSPYPNPFNSTVRLPFVLNKGGNVQLKLYNMQGEFLGSPFSSTLTAGHYSPTIQLDHLASGTYFIHIDADGKVLSKSISLLK